MGSIPTSRAIGASAFPLPAVLVPGNWPTALAPMQDVTDGPFFRLLSRYGVPDFFFTEFSRVHSHSRLETGIQDAVLNHGTGRPVFLQLMGESLPDLERTVREVSALPIAGIDLNVGCPVPKVYKRNVGGGLLRDLPQLDRILGCLRQSIEGLFTVKMRLGFSDTESFPKALGLVAKHRADLLSVHGRTVSGGYRSEVDYGKIAEAVNSVPCPVLANGNVQNWRDALRIKNITGAYGIMVGRAAIRNPWIFRQIREAQSGHIPFQPTLGDVRAYVDDLWASRFVPGLDETRLVARMKKFLNFVGLGVDPEGAFLHAMRRSRTESELFTICDRFMMEGERSAIPYAEEPFSGLLARPNCEAQTATCGL